MSEALSHSVNSRLKVSIFILLLPCVQCYIRQNRQNHFGRNLSQLLKSKSKRLPCLLFGDDVLPLNKTELRSIDCSVLEVKITIFRKLSASNISEYKFYLNFPSVEICVELRVEQIHFFTNTRCIFNVLCETFAQVALHQLSSTEFALEKFIFVCVCLIVYHASVNKDVHNITWSSEIMSLQQQLPWRQE